MGILFWIGFEATFDSAACNLWIGPYHYYGEVVFSSVCLEINSLTLLCVYGQWSKHSWVFLEVGGVWQYCMPLAIFLAPGVGVELKIPCCFVVHYPLATILIIYSTNWELKIVYIHAANKNSSPEGRIWGICCWTYVTRGTSNNAPFSCCKIAVDNRRAAPIWENKSEF